MMAIIVANRTAQSGTYYTGSPNYVDMSAGAAEAGMVTFPDKATDASWSDGVEIGVAVVKDNNNWQVWRATWDETNEYLEVVEVEDSAGTLSNADAVTVTATLTEAHVQPLINGREVLTANRTYYVRTDGSDSNTGLADSAGGAFLTIQYAVNVVANTLAIAGKQVTIQVGNGTYSENVILKICQGVDPTLPVLIQGDTTTPSNVVISSTGTAISAYGIPHPWRITGLKLVSTSIGISSTSGSIIQFTLVDFGACTNYHINATTSGIAHATGNYSVTGSAAVHWFLEYGGLGLFHSRTVTITGTPAFSAGWAISRHCSVISAYSMTFSGSATGKRYDLILNGVCFVNGAGTSYLPGNSSGTTATGGQYA